MLLLSELLIPLLNKPQNSGHSIALLSPTGITCCVHDRYAHFMGKRGANLIMLAHCPVQRSSNTISSMCCPPSSPGPWHVGVESQTLCLFSLSHLKKV